MLAFWGETHSGAFVNYVDPQADQIDIEDIAHHLGNLCRYTGATPGHYSVAEHSVACARLMIKRGAALQYVFAALMHDAHEAYVGDISGPLLAAIREQTTFLDQLSYRFDTVISAKFGVDLDIMRSKPVREVDHELLAVEAYWLMRSAGEGEQWGRLPPVSLELKHSLKPHCWRPQLAKEQFMRYYNSIQTQLIRREVPGYRPLATGVPNRG